MAKHSEYLKIFIAHMDKFRQLEKKRDETTKEMRRVHQMAKAALAMMPDEERRAMETRFKEWELPTEGLTAAIRNVLFEKAYQALKQNKRDMWMNAVHVKDALDQAGYDFSAYRSNPLISVHGILKRLERKELNFREMPDGSRGYRLNSKEMAKRLIAPKAQGGKGVREALEDVARAGGFKIAWPEQQIEKNTEETEDEPF